MTWPNDNGPLHALREAGATDTAIPPWVRRTHAFTDEGQEVFITHPAFLSSSDLSQLAALADDYEISAYPRSDGRIRVVIRKDVTP